MYQKDYKLASEIAVKHADHPIPRWREWFAQVKNHIAYADGLNSGELKAPENGQDWNDDSNQRLLSNARESDQLEQSKKLPTMDLVVEGTNVKLESQNIALVSVNYYLMDIELLFTRNPFVQGGNNRTSSIQPNYSESLEIKRGSKNVALQIPDKLKNKNLVIEVTGGGLNRSTVVYANSLAVSLSTGTEGFKPQRQQIVKL